MQTEVVDFEGYSFIKVFLLAINQKGNQFFVGKILANDMLNVYTVRPAEYDISKNKSFAKSFGDDREYYDFLIAKDQQLLDGKDFQRDYDITRVNKIANFLETEEFPFFPNTVICTAELINAVEDFDITLDSSFEDFASLKDRPKHLSFLQQMGGIFYLYVPYTSNTLLVIDGQHRMRGLEKTTKELKTNYEVLVSLILNYDRSVVAKLFYTINYEQKSVNKSLLYHLMGEFSTDLDEITFMHNTIKVLNELDYSPFHNKIKMLGINPKNSSQNDRNSLTISQAFFLDYLIKTISKNSANSLFQPIFMWYFKNSDYQIDIIRFLVKYFDAIKSIKKQDWDNPNTSVLTKGIGIAALLKVLHVFFVKIFIDVLKRDPKGISDITEEFLKAKLKGLENVDFSNTGEFGGVGSGGSINKIFQRIIEKVDYFGTSNYQAFSSNFKETYIEEFRNWLSKNK